MPQHFQRHGCATWGTGKLLHQRRGDLFQLDGASLVPELRDPHRASGRAVVTMLDTGHYSVRDARWRYIRYGDGSEELYDHHKDPHEWYNLAALEQYRKVREQMARYLPADPVAPPSRGALTW